MNKSCGCFYGTCDCGPSQDYNLLVVFDLKKQELFLWDKTNTSYNADYFCKTMGWYLIGEFL